MTSTTSAVLEIGGIGFDVGHNTKQTVATVLREYCSCAHARRNTGIPISDNLKQWTQNHDGYFTITSTPLFASTLDPRSSARNPTRASLVHDEAKKPRGQRPALTSDQGGRDFAINRHGICPPFKVIWDRDSYVPPCMSFCGQYSLTLAFRYRFLRTYLWPTSNFNSSRHFFGRFCWDFVHHT